MREGGSEAEIKWNEREREREIKGEGKIWWWERKGKYPRCRDTELCTADITVTGRRSWRRETRAMPGELYMIQKHNHLPLDLPNSAENRPSASNRPCGCRYPAIRFTSQLPTRRLPTAFLGIPSFLSCPILSSRKWKLENRVR